MIKNFGKTVHSAGMRGSVSGAQGMTEYVILLGVVIVAVVALGIIFKTQLDALAVKITDSISAATAKMAVTPPTV